MDPEIRQFVTSDGYRHHYRFWCPGESKPKGYVVALHGIQSHSGWYEYSSGRLCEAGYAVCFLDRRGSGLNQQQRGDVLHYRRLVNDVAQVLAEVRCRRNREAPVSPVVLLAVSWGGKLAAVTAAQRPELIDGLALLYPGIRSRIGPNWRQRLLLWLAGRLGVRERRVPIPLDDPALFTGEQEWQDYIRNDALSLKEATVSFLLADRQLSHMATLASESIRCPVLLMLAGKDQIIDNAAMQQYFAGMASHNRKLLVYPETQHTLEFEPDREQFVDDLIDWLNSIRVLC